MIILLFEVIIVDIIIIWVCLLFSYIFNVLFFVLIWVSGNIFLVVFVVIIWWWVIGMWCIIYLVCVMFLIISFLVIGCWVCRLYVMDGYVDLIRVFFWGKFFVYLFWCFDVIGIIFMIVVFVLFLVFVMLVGGFKIFWISVYVFGLLIVGFIVILFFIGW